MGIFKPFPYPPILPNFLGVTFIKQLYSYSLEGPKSCTNKTKDN